MELKGTNIAFKYPLAKDYLLKNIDIHLDNKKISDKDKKKYENMTIVGLEPTTTRLKALCSTN